MNYKEMFSGFGNSFILQGAGLLVFDVSMFYLNKKNRTSYFGKALKNTQISLLPRAIGLKIRI